jgi:hypothetical protein
MGFCTEVCTDLVGIIGVISQGHTRSVLVEVIDQRHDAMKRQSCIGKLL